MTGESLDALLAAAAADAADVTALVCGPRRYTYAELDAAVRAGAAAWLRDGLAPGDRVAVWAANTADCAVVMLSVIVAGGVLVPLNPRYTAREVGQLLPRVRCRYVVASAHTADRRLADEVLPIAGDATVVVIDGEPGADPDRGTPPAGPRHWAELVRGAGPGQAAQPSPLAAIQFTSGTTGRPKGALLKQAPMIGTARTWARVVGLSRGDRYPVLYPLAHVGGFKTGLVSCIHARATIELLPVVSAAGIVTLVRGGGVTVLNAPPTAQAYVLAARRAGELPGDLGIRTAVIGSAVVAPELVRGLLRDVGVGDVVIGYGLTEATGVCTMTRRGDPVDLVCGTIGRPIDGVRARVHAPGPDGVGELEVAGYNVMAGYLDDPQATADALRDGWLRTGDLCRIGDDGYVRLAGRARDLVIVGGFNVYPAEVENALGEHPAVREAVVVGVPHARLGEVPAAYVVASDMDSEALAAWCRERLANFKVPRHIWLVEDLPRTPHGKVARAELAERAAATAPAGRADRPPPP
ncbi:AMP-binding protein [Phytohabitans kaempferiae]|uniref:AMP-binding protein n=1 Tax=Phytohabitans kaempferiae TaxID=1620943 RepID=A0ABV6LY03_9ACTN